MNKVELATELRGYQIPCHDKWLVRELRTMVMEQRKAREGPKEDHVLKGLSRLNLEELVEKAKKEGLTIPPKPTRGALMAMLRVSTQSPGDQVMPFGKFKGWMYKETPKGYRDWAVQEVASNPNHHPDLGRYASWAETEEKRQTELLKTKDMAATKYLVDDPEVNAKVPVPNLAELGMPGSATSSDGSWQRVRGAAPKAMFKRRSRAEEDDNSDLQPDLSEEALEKNPPGGDQAGSDQAEVWCAPSTKMRDDGTTTDEGACPQDAENRDQENVNEDEYIIHITAGNQEISDEGEDTDHYTVKEPTDGISAEAKKEKAREGIRRRRLAAAGPGKHVRRGAHLVWQAFTICCATVLSHAAEIVAEPAGDLWAVFQSRHVDADEEGCADLLELFAGKAHISKAFAQHRMSVLQPRDLQYGHDLRQRECQDQVLNEILRERPRLVWAAPPCTAWCGFSRLNYSIQERKRRRRKEEVFLHFLEKVQEAVLAGGGHFAIENPRSSDLWRHPRVRRWVVDPRMQFAEVDMCQYGLKSLVEEAPLRKGMSILTSSPGLATRIGARCPGDHVHRRVEGADTAATATYPWPFARCVAKAVKDSCLRTSEEVLAVDQGEAKDTNSDDVELLEEHSGANGISFKGKINPITAGLLRRVHQNLGHPTNRELVRHLRIGGANAALIQGAQQLRCRTCDRSTRARPHKVAKPVTALDFNEVVAIDIIWLEAADSEGAGIPALNMVDVASTYQVVYPVESTKSGDAAKAFVNGWVSWAGAPRHVIIDLDSAFKDKFLEAMDQMAVSVRCAAGQAHWQNSVAERQGDSWKAIWPKHVDATFLTKDEAAEAMTAINAAKNGLRNRSGFSPRQWVFGCNERLPGDPFDAPEERGVVEIATVNQKFARSQQLRAAARNERLPGDPFDAAEERGVVEIATVNQKFARSQQLRAAARAAFCEVQASDALQRALKHKPRVESAPYEAGALVYVLRQTKPTRGKRPSSIWLGPAVVLGREGSNY